MSYGIVGVLYDVTYMEYDVVYSDQSIVNGLSLTQTVQLAPVQAVPLAVHHEAVL